MQTQIITIYCICADYLKALGFRDDRQARLSSAEVMTTALVAAALFKGCLESSRVFLQEHGYMPNMLSKSRLIRRLHAIPEGVWQGLFHLLAGIHHQANARHEYVVDSLPVPVCDNIRIRRCRLYRSEAYRGYIASKRRYFYGLRVHLLITAAGQPVEFVLAPGADADISVFKGLPLDLPEHSTIYADKAYTHYAWEDWLAEHASITLTPLRKANAKRQLAGWVRYLCLHTRKRIETSFSQIAALFARTIHAVTPRGFELKVFLAILAFSICG
jgi:hypothetical protein